MADSRLPPAAANVGLDDPLPLAIAEKGQQQLDARSRRRLHDRCLEVNAANIAIESAVLDLARERRLTAGEVVRILVGVLARWSEYVVRAERHPEDPTKKADEA